MTTKSPKITSVEKNDDTSEDEVSENEESSENESDDGSYNEEDDGISIADLMQTFFAGENGKNIVDTVESLKKSIDQQNKILMKFGGLMEKIISNQ